jgi:heme exporter protein D
MNKPLPPTLDLWETGDERPTRADRLRGAVWAAAALSLAAGVALTFHSLRLAREASQDMAQHLRELARVRSLEAGVAARRAAQQSFDALAVRQPTNLVALAVAAMPSAQPEDVRETRHELAAGWSVRQVELTFREASIAKAMEFVSIAESQPLPWRLTKCVLRATPGVAGTGHIALTMEALEKAP